MAGLTMEHGWPLGVRAIKEKGISVTQLQGTDFFPEKVWKQISPQSLDENLPWPTP